jgi:transmembrane sensor
MNPFSENSGGGQRETPVERAAGDWLARIDRGLTPAEAEAFAAWEAADPRHAAEFRRLTELWQQLDRADEMPALRQLAPVRERPQRRLADVLRPRWTWGALGAAAALALAAIGNWNFVRQPFAGTPPAAAEGVAYRVIPEAGRRLTLADGTGVRLNADAEIEEAFTASERRVRLLRGEAHFTVVPDAARPFVVAAGPVAVRAVGTAFNIRLGGEAIEVLVTEGRVRVDDAAGGRSLLAAIEETPAEATAVLGAGARVVLALADPGPATPVAVASEEIGQALAWLGPQLVFDRTPLADVVSAFNRFNRRQLVLGDPALAARLVGGTFRADHVDAFVRLLETGFEIAAEPRGDGEIVLRPMR